MAPSPARLNLPIAAHALARIASGASAVLVALDLAHLSNRGLEVGVGLVGILAASSYGAELLASVPLGVMSDAVSARALMSVGALAAAVATQLFGLSISVALFMASRLLEGIAVAAITPPMLRYLAQSTMTNAGRRARALSFFELSLLAGLALGGLVATQLWAAIQVRAFSGVALLYVLCAALLFFSTDSRRGEGRTAARAGLKRAFKDPFVRHLAPVWLCVNAVVGLWLGPTLTFLLTQKPASTQYLDGIFASKPTDMGWLLLGYTAVFGAGVSIWSVLLPKFDTAKVLRVSLIAMFAVCVGLYALNHSRGLQPLIRWTIEVITGLLIMIESGFGPAALIWLAQALGRHEGKGTAMGIYSMLLSLGALGGSLLAGLVGALWRIDGLLLGTVLLAALALFLLIRIPAPWIPAKQEAS